MSYETISGGAKKFAAIGDSCEGYLIGVTPPKSDDGNNVLHFQALTGKETFDAFSSTALNNVLLVDGAASGPTDSPKIKKEFLGCKVRVELTGFGTAPKKGFSPPKQFKIQVDRKARR